MCYICDCTCVSAFKDDGANLLWCCTRVFPILWFPKEFLPRWNPAATTRPVSDPRRMEGADHRHPECSKHTRQRVSLRPEQPLLTQTSGRAVKPAETCPCSTAGLEIKAELQGEHGRRSESREELVDLISLTRRRGKRGIPPALTIPLSSPASNHGCLDLRREKGEEEGMGWIFPLCLCRGATAGLRDQELSPERGFGGIAAPSSAILSCFPFLFSFHHHVQG